MKHLLSFSLAVFFSLVLNAQNLSGPWTGRISVGQNALTLVMNFSYGEDGSLSCTFDSPDQGAKGIPAKVEEINEYSVTVSVPSIGASYKGILMGESIMGTFSQSGLDIPLTLKKGEEKLNRPQTPEPPFPYGTEEVTFANEPEGATLSGTLTIPEGYSHDTPVVIMVTGSGMQNRDEEIFGHKPFFVIADHLARHGIASLRYDDRGTGRSEGGEVKTATTVNYMHDALAGISFLRKDGRFGKLGVIGHSEGANIAIMLGARGEADFIISLAGVGVKGDEALTAQANRVYEISGLDTRMTVDMYRHNIRMQSSAWLNWFIDYDPTQDISTIKCPVMAVNGDKDIQVISSLNLTAVADKLQGDSRNFIKEYPGLNHLFQHCETGDVTEYRKIEETFSREVLDDMASWILGLKK